MKYWLLVIVWTISIFSLIPLARSLQQYVVAGMGRNAFLYLTGLALVSGFLLACTYAIRQPQRLAVLRLLVLILCAAAFSYWAWQLRAYPERTFHFVQYGVLSVLLFRALRERLSDSGIYLLALLITATVGIADEIVQWFTPQRFFDYDDIIINAGAGFLALTAVALGIQPSGITFKPKLSTLRKASVAFAVFCFLLLLTFCNTPQLANKYATPHWPWRLARDNPSLMADYGIRHEIPGGIRFISRFTPTELAAIDRETGNEAGQLIAENYSPNQYPEFLKQTLTSNPLAYEARVRLFRRDAHWQRAREFKEGSHEFREHLAIAYLEHLILAAAYPNTYHFSRRRLGLKDAQWMESYFDLRIVSASPVGNDLLVLLSQRQYVFVLGALLLVSLLLRYKLRAY